MHHPIWLTNTSKPVQLRSELRRLRLIFSIAAKLVSIASANSTDDLRYCVDKKQIVFHNIYTVSKHCFNMGKKKWDNLQIFEQICSVYWRWRLFNFKLLFFTWASFWISIQKRSRSERPIPFHCIANRKLSPLYSNALLLIYIILSKQQWILNIICR